VTSSRKQDGFWTGASGRKVNCTCLTVQLTEALANVHRIAVSRGERLPSPAYEDLDAIDDEDDELDASQPTQHA